MKKENKNNEVVNTVMNTTASNESDTVNVFFPYGIFDEDDECVVDATTMLQLTEEQVKGVAEGIMDADSVKPTLGMFHDIEQDVVDKIFAEEFARMLPDVDEDDYCDYYVHVDYALPEELLEAVKPYLNRGQMHVIMNEETI